jgi:arylsulfatase A-like enzyme
VVATAGLLLAGCARPPRPNVIVILADDLGYGGLGCYGQQKVATPQIDRLAAEGVRFTDFHSGSTVCAPSRCCLMTGKHTGRARIRANSAVPLAPDDVTLAASLRQAGYRTGLVGKWGLGEADTTGVPTRQGFDTFFGFLNQTHAHNYYPDFLWRGEQREPLAGNQGKRRTQYSHDLFTAEALKFVEQPADRPFFLYLAYTIPHTNNELKRRTGDGMEVPDYGPYATRDWTNPQKGYAAMIDRMDRDVGRLIARLAELGLDSRTLVLFTSDNGPHKEGGFDYEFFDCNGPLRGIKRDLYEGGIRVPCIVRWPGRVQPGVCETPLAFWDVMPTFCELAGAPRPSDLDGRSFAAGLQGGRWPSPRPMYWEFHEGGFHQAVRDGQWKAVRHNLGPIELYDLAADPGEARDVAGEHRDIVRRMERHLTSMRQEDPRWPIKLNTPQVPL